MFLKISTCQSLQYGISATGASEAIRIITVLFVLILTLVLFIRSSENTWAFFFFYSHSVRFLRIFPLLSLCPIKVVLYVIKEIIIIIFIIFNLLHIQLLSNECFFLPVLLTVRTDTQTSMGCRVSTYLMISNFSQSIINA